jgi:hypothetical protein
MDNLNVDGAFLTMCLKLAILCLITLSKEYEHAMQTCVDVGVSIVDAYFKEDI